MLICFFSGTEKSKRKTFDINLWRNNKIDHDIGFEKAKFGWLYKDNRRRNQDLLKAHLT
jgi:hypothetical protein